MTDTERYLCRYYQLERLKQSAENTLMDAALEYQSKSESLLHASALSLTPPTQTNMVKNPVADAVVKMVDTYAKRMTNAQWELDEITKEQASIKTTVEKADLNTLEKSYVLLRYFKGNRTWQTAQRMQYSERHVNRFKASALTKINAVIKDG